MFFFFSSKLHRYSHGFRRVFTARHIVRIKTIFLQFFSCKSVKNWLSYAHFNSEVTIVTVAKTGRLPKRVPNLPVSATRDNCDLRIEMSITQSILNRFAWKKLQKNVLICTTCILVKNPWHPWLYPCSFLKFVNIEEKIKKTCTIK